MGNSESQVLVKADLFIKANSDVENAKNLFKEVKKTIDESYVTFGTELFSQLETQLSEADTNINNLITRIDNTLESLIEIDPDFANEYMTILTYQANISFLDPASIPDAAVIDTSDMTEEEKQMFQRNCQRQYDFAVLSMLERLEANGQLTPEIEEMIEQTYGINYDYQKAVCEQYRLMDEMSGIDTLSEEFKTLYEEYTEQRKNIILFAPNMDESTRQTKLNEIETQYNETIKAIDENLAARTKARQEERLQKLQLEKEYNNGLFHPGVEYELEQEIISLRAEMGDESAIEYMNMSDWEKGWHYAGTVCLSTFEGFVDLGEGIFDAGVFLTGETVQALSFGYVDNKWAEDIISFDASSELYDWAIDTTGINPEIAYGSARSVGNFAGEVLGYYALSAVPVVGPALCALAGAGKKVEENIIYQKANLKEGEEIDDGRVWLNFVLGAAEGYGAGKAAGSMKQGFENFSQLKGAFGTEGFKATMSSARTIAKRAMVNTFTNDFDAWLETAAVIADDVYTGFETGEWDIGKMYAEASGVMLQNFIGNLGAEAFKNYASVNLYKNDVLSTMEQNYRKSTARSEWDAMHGKGAFDNLSDLDKANLMASVDADAVAAKMIENERIVNNSITNARNQYEAGVFDKKYTVGEILEGYKGDQMQFWSTKGYEDWKNDFGKYVDGDGNIKVYSFQDGSIGANNIIKFGGDTSLPEGSFVMSERQYLELLADRTVFDAKGNCIDPEKLSDLTGGCNFGNGKNIIAVEQTVKLDDITLPYGSHPNAYPGWWSPGGKTVTVSGVGYCTEGIAPYNNYSNGNVNIISHNSRYNTKYYTNPLS